jgi:putative peptide zinc metalloprotease protein
VWLVCLGGDRYIHATARLYHVLLHADGTCPVGEIARRVTSATGEATTAEQVVALVDQRLRPAGLVAANGGDRGPRRPKPRQLVAIRHRLPLLPSRATAPAVAILQHLHWPPVVVLAVAAAAAINVWLYIGPGFRGAAETLVAQPAALLLVLGLDLGLRLVHELGHASALRRGGVRHGTIGVALYVVLPVFYADVTHAYRLSRGPRIRVDLGGMYFDCLSTIALFGAFLATGHPAFLLVIVLTGMAMLTEFTPFMRFDGYYLLADVIGVHEPMSLLGQLVRDLWPGRWGRRRYLQIRRSARLVLLGYLAVVVLFLGRPALLLVVAGRQVLAAFTGQGARLGGDALAAFQGQDWARLVLDGVSLATWALVPIGLAVFSASLVRLAWRGTRAVLDRLSERLAERPARHPGQSG